MCATELACRAERLYSSAWFQIFMKPIRNNAAGLALNCNRQRIRLRRRRRNRIATIDRFAVDLQLKRYELSGPEPEQSRRSRAKQEAFDIVRFWPDMTANQRVIRIRVPLWGQRFPQRTAQPAFRTRIAHKPSTRCHNRTDRRTRAGTSLRL